MTIIITAKEGVTNYISAYRRKGDQLRIEGDRDSRPSPSIEPIGGSVSGRLVTTTTDSILYVCTNAIGSGSDNTFRPGKLLYGYR